MKDFFSSSGYSSNIIIEYLKNLYKLNYPSAYEDQMGNRFMGIIKKVTPDGKLEVALEDDSVKHYGLKEIKMLY